jgi:hypothetical protein
MKLNDSPGGIPQIGCSTSALGQKRTFSNVRRMSALPPKAEIIRRRGDVRLVPKAETINGLHGDGTAKRIVSVSGINKTGTADGEEFLHFTHCFGNHVMRLISRHSHASCMDAGGR